MADVADLVKVSDAIDNVDEGFVAWMGVSPRFPESNRLVTEMLRQVFTTMKQRGLKHIWLSWELHNGLRQLTAADFVSLNLIDRLEYNVYRLTL